MARGNLAAARGAAARRGKSPTSEVDVRPDFHPVGTATEGSTLVRDLTRPLKYFLRSPSRLGKNQASHRLRMWGFFLVAPPPPARPLDCHAPCLRLITIPCGTMPTPLRRAKRRTRRPSRPRPT